MANAVARSVIKSGWLWRRTNVLHRWKQNWFVLWSSGRLMFYEDEKQSQAEDIINIPMERPRIFAAEELRGKVEPPTGIDPNCLLGLQVAGPDGDNTWYLCAESPDEAYAWRVAFEEATHITSITPFVPATPYRQQAAYYYPPEDDGNQTYFIPNYYGPGRHFYLPPGAQVVYIDRRPYYRDPDTGLLFALALGSLLLCPFLWPWVMLSLLW